MLVTPTCTFDMSLISCIRLLQHFCPGTIVFRARAGWTWDDITQSQAHAGWALLRWLLFGTGPMSALCGQAAVFTRSDDKRRALDSPLPYAQLTYDLCAVFPMDLSYQ